MQLWTRKITSLSLRNLFIESSIYIQIKLQNKKGPWKSPRPPPSLDRWRLGGSRTALNHIWSIISATEAPIIKRKSGLESEHLSQCPRICTAWVYLCQKPTDMWPFEGLPAKPENWSGFQEATGRREGSWDIKTDTHPSYQLTLTRGINAHISK
jgi:hypothetical protein